MSGTPRKAMAGFTLLETLVALAILGIVLTSVYGVFGSGLRAAQRDEDRLLLALVARNLLARSALDLYPGTGTLSGDIGGGLRWSIAGTPFALPEDLLPETTALAGDQTAGARAGMSLGGGQLGRGDGAGPSSTQGTGSGFGSGSAGYGSGGSSGLGSSPGLGGSSGLGTGSGSGFGDGGTGFADRGDGGFGGDTGGLPGQGSGSAGLGESSAADGLGREDERGVSGRQRAREKVRLLMVTVTTEKGKERFQLTGLVQEPRRDDSSLLR